MELNKAAFPTCSRLVLACLLIAPRAEQRSGDGGGWSPSSDSTLEDEGPCNIDVLDRSSLSHQQFIERYAYSRPVILRGLTDNTKFRSLCSKSSLLQEYGDRRVRLSTANTYSYRKVDVRFQEYVDVFLRPQSNDALGSDTLYFFGDNNFTEWQGLFEHYESPPYVLPHTSGAYSFGIAGPGTGVPFHWHGPGYSEVIYGRKVLYFPDRWWHATLNLDTSVFISTFLG
ncbi:jmjC domain-containing protein 8 isoform X2 [Xiphias gladius]|uniref:jmjC domain-containing protein 8 isoform X2 n=1 Tax=Xiphias gladius TaxID=8245 RepID=UPI001A9960CF|nr:jmjC domain-containing protein 8 isoform X2 [Xiphias gladius]